MAVDDVKRQAKAEIRRRVWASERGIATRTYIREHPEVEEEFKTTGTILGEVFPTNVTRASVLLELHQRARRREASADARQWEKDHPKEAEEMRARIREEMSGARE